MTENKNKSARKTKFLVYIDDDDYSKVALRFACSKAKATGCPVEMLYVLEPADYASFSGVADVMRKERREKAEQVLTKLAEDAYNFANITPSLIVKEGVAKEQIVKTIEEDYDIGMLVMGNPPEFKAAKNKLLLWVVSQIGGKLHIPVMVVPGNLLDSQIKELT